jgi:acetylornithine deacetylase/succinyl-diaminopimelate desuccinylase-like protein
VLLYGHYDVQPPDPLDLWISPPFEPTIRDGRIFARGVADNKGQHLAQILAIESHLKVHGALPCNVILLLEGEEEVGSPHIADFVRDNRELLQADLAVTADGPLHPSGHPTIKFGSRGVVNFELHARHAKRDVHSGNFGGVVPNPLWTLVHLLATMKNERGDITIEGFHDDIVPPTPQELEAAARLPLDLAAVKGSLGLERLDVPPERDYYERLCFRPTLTINGLHGGYGGPGAKTVLPHEAVAKCAGGEIRGARFRHAALEDAADGRACGAAAAGRARGTRRRAAALSGGLWQPARLCVHENPRDRRVRHALWQS